MMRTYVIVGSFALLAGASAMGGEVWYEDFDSYAAGSWLHGQGGWKGWDNVPSRSAAVTDSRALSAPHSLRVKNSEDVVNRFVAYASGQWTFQTSVFIPSGPAQASNLNLLDRYRDGGTPHWAVVMFFVQPEGIVLDSITNSSLPLITDRWVDVRIEMDFENDWKSIYYDGQLLSETAWTNGFGRTGPSTGRLQLAAVNLYGNVYGNAFYDNLSITPEPSSWMLLMVGLGLARRRAISLRSGGMLGCHCS